MRTKPSSSVMEKSLLAADSLIGSARPILTAELRTFRALLWDIPLLRSADHFDGNVHALEDRRMGRPRCGMLHHHLFGRATLEAKTESGASDGDRFAIQQDERRRRVFDTALEAIPRGHRYFARNLRSQIGGIKRDEAESSTLQQQVCRTECLL